MSKQENKTPAVKSIHTILDKDLHDSLVSVLNTEVSTSEQWFAFFQTCETKGLEDKHLDLKTTREFFIESAKDTAPQKVLDVINDDDLKGTTVIEGVLSVQGKTLTKRDWLSTLRKRGEYAIKRYRGYLEARAAEEAGEAGKSASKARGTKESYTEIEKMAGVVFKIKETMGNKEEPTQQEMDISKAAALMLDAVCQSPAAKAVVRKMEKNELVCRYSLSKK